MILVLPDAYTIYDGSMFSSSPTTSDWETFIADDDMGRRCEQTKNNTFFLKGGGLLRAFS